MDGQGGIKFDTGKPRMDLLDPYAMEELSKVLTFGAQKYDDWNWSKGIKFSRVVAAVLRHVFAFLRGETIDPESGLHHMAHAMCGCMFIIGLTHYKPESDDRHAVHNETEKTRTSNVSTTGISGGTQFPNYGYLPQISAAGGGQLRSPELDYRSIGVCQAGGLQAGANQIRRQEDQGER